MRSAGGGLTIKLKRRRRASDAPRVRGRAYAPFSSLFDRYSCAMAVSERMSLMMKSRQNERLKRMRRKSRMRFILPISMLTVTSEDVGLQTSDFGNSSQIVGNECLPTAHYTKYCHLTLARLSSNAWSDCFLTASRINATANESKADVKRKHAKISVGNLGTIPV